MASKEQNGTGDLDRDKVSREFAEVVNMMPSELAKWLKTSQSKSVGFTHSGANESVGHQSGRKIIAIKHKNKAQLTDADYAHMRSVVGYVHRHLAQGGPSEDEERSPWRYSLMNWGHDPDKT